MTSRRPLAYFWPDPRVEFVAVDFLDPVEKIVAKLRNICAPVTHTYFTSYVHHDDFKVLKEQNVPLFKNFMDAVDEVCPNLQRVCLQTGGKVSLPYFEVLFKVLHSGCGLSLSKLPVLWCSPWACQVSSIGGHAQIRRQGLQLLLRPRGLSKGGAKETKHVVLECYSPERNQWICSPRLVHLAVAMYLFTKLTKLCSTTANGMSEALTVAIYMLICRELGQPAQFPGNEYFWNSIDDNSYAPSLADLTIHATTKDNCKNEDFLHCNGDVFVWKYLWQDVAKYFGVEVCDLIYI